MNVNTLPVYLAVLSGLVALLFDTRRRARDGGASGRLRADAEVLKILPENSAAHRKVLEHMSDTVDTLVKQRTTLTRDANGIGVSVFLCSIAAALIYAGHQVTGGVKVTLFAFASPFALFGTLGFSVSLPRRERDAKGNTKKPPQRAE